MNNSDLAIKHNMGERQIQVKTKKAEINSACNIAVISGFTSSTLGEAYFYYSTLEEQSTLNSLLNLKVHSPFKAQKVLEDGSLAPRIKHFHTAKQMLDILGAGALHIDTQIDKKDRLKIDILNATTVEEIESIVW